MKRVLVLGGTGEGMQLARQLGADAVYSVAGLGRKPVGLRCEVREGGFGGAEGLAEFLRRERIELLIDATHPYAAKISTNARMAASSAGVPLWAVRRAGWAPEAGDDWRMVDDWSGVIAALEGFRHPLFTLGREPLAHLEDIPPTQCWTIRCLDDHPGHARARIIADRGPYTLDAERALFAQEGFDALVSKNSGGDATVAKLQVAREGGLPVVMLARPALPDADRSFEHANALLEALA